MLEALGRVAARTRQQTRFGNRFRSKTLQTPEIGATKPCGPNPRPLLNCAYEP